MDTIGFDPNTAFPPLRPAAAAVPKDAHPHQHQLAPDIPSTGLGDAAVAANNGNGEIAPPRQIEEHEVEMYKEQDVRRSSLSLSPSPVWDSA